MPFNYHVGRWDIMFIHELKVKKKVTGMSLNVLSIYTIMLGSSILPKEFAKEDAAGYLGNLIHLYGGSK
jgi:hypothetical protein